MSPLMSARKRAGMSIGEVARLVGVTPAHISKLERNKGGCSPRLAEKLFYLLRHNGLTEEKILYPQRFSKKEAA